ncbi:MAG: hypothetical protein ACREM1_18370 [Longimicrobiales bacterium]
MIGHCAALASVVAVACAGTGAIASGPVVQPYETEAVAGTSLDQPLHVLFSWRIEEPDGRFSGHGATRVEPPHHARLDLFGPRGEAYLMAALVDMELRLPAGADGRTLPPPALLWAALGMFRPPDGARLTGTAREGETTRLDYVRDDERWMFRLEGGRLRWAEWTRSDGRRTIELEGDAEHGLPRQAVYRDWPAFRELRLTVDEVNATQGFDDEIWTVGTR